MHIKNNYEVEIMNELEQARQEIVKIDSEMAHLFEARMKICKNIAYFKKKHALPINDTKRETELINKNRVLINDVVIEDYYVEFLKILMSISCKYQSRLINGLKVAYSGVKGAFGYIAAKKMFPQAKLIACPNFEDAYNMTENGNCDCTVLPLENSYAGEVGTVMDLMFSGNLYVNQIIDMDIVHNLIACKDVNVNNIKTVISHPQALEQCEDYLKRHNLKSVPYSNTALAAQYVKETNNPTIATIASSETADIYDLKIIDKEINSVKNNTTRFAAFSRSQNKLDLVSASKNEHFILLFTVRNEAGALAQTLNIIGAHGFNMRNLRSRPMKRLLWNYFFYLEAEGNINTQNGKDMLQELSAICANLKLVGTYCAKNPN